MVINIKMLSLMLPPDDLPPSQFPCEALKCGHVELVADFARHLLARSLLELAAQHVGPFFLVLVVLAGLVDAELGLDAVDCFVAHVFLAVEGC